VSGAEGLKDRRRRAEQGCVRYQRLTLEAGTTSVTVPFHPRLTVVAGVGRAEREGLLGELVGALAGTRRGATVEVVDDAGSRLVVRRHELDPAADAVRDGDGAERTAAFARPDGRVDVLAGYGLAPADVRRRARITASDVAAASRSEALVSSLARKDQATLWRSAEMLAATDANLKNEAEVVGAAPEDAELIERIELRHEAFELAQAQLEKVRHLGVFTGGACALGGVPAYLMNRTAALGFVIAAALTLAVGIVYRRRKTKAERLEQEALAAAGAESYIGFHIRRMNELLEGQASRDRLAQAAAAHRRAAIAWQELVGEVSVEWALGNRGRIEATARRLAAAGDPDVDLPSLETAIEPAEVAQALIARMTDLRHAGRGGEGVPLVLDEPFSACEPSVKAWLLELVGRAAGTPQVVLLTDDPDVAAWARVEALAGHLAVIEPAPVDSQSEAA
jgi:hypothetical protein